MKKSVVGRGNLRCENMEESVLNLSFYFHFPPIESESVKVFVSYSANEFFLRKCIKFVACVLNFCGREKKWPR